MYKVLILYDCIGWAYYFRAQALQKYKPKDFHIDISNKYAIELRKGYDLVFQLCFSYIKTLKQHIDRGKYKCKVVSSYNVGWNYKNEWLKEPIQYSDMVIINNYEMWDKSGRLPKTHHISNGVDTTIYKPRIPYKQRKFKILWTGSKHHRSNKNYDNIILPLSKELTKRKIIHDFRLVNSTSRDKYSQGRMVDWYNLGQCCVVAAKTEGTPNPALESLSCGLPVVSTRCGNMPEIIVDGHNGYLCDANVQSLLNGILEVEKNKEQMSVNAIESIKSWDWSIRSKQFFDLFRKVIRNEKL